MSSVQLLSLIESCPLDSTVIVLAASALARTVTARRDVTIAALEGLDVLTKLAKGVRTQQHAQNCAQVQAEDHAMP